jgi:OmpA-OmpF porin, OOP family
MGKKSVLAMLLLSGLSQQRADAVKSYIAQKGIDDTRLQAVGYGSAKPIAANTTAAGRAQN